MHQEPIALILCVLTIGKPRSNPRFRFSVLMGLWVEKDLLGIDLTPFIIFCWASPCICNMGPAAPISGRQIWLPMQLLWPLNLLIVVFRVQRFDAHLHTYMSPMFAW